MKLEGGQNLRGVRLFRIDSGVARVKWCNIPEVIIRAVVVPGTYNVERLEFTVKKRLGCFPVRRFPGRSRTCPRGGEGGFAPSTPSLSKVASNFSLRLTSGIVPVSAAGPVYSTADVAGLPASTAAAGFLSKSLYYRSILMKCASESV